MKKLDINNPGRANHHVLRDFNEMLVLNMVRERQPISRVDIAKLTGLEGSTISKIVTRMLDDEFIYEDGRAAASSLGGRKKRLLHLNPQKVYAVGVDLSFPQYTVALSDFSGHILRSDSLASQADPQLAMKAVAKSVNRMLQTAAAKDRVAGIGVSLVGLVDPLEGRILVGENLGWGEDVPVGSLLRDALNSDLPVYFENGSRLAALAETWFGRHASRQLNDLVFLDVGDGIGAGIIIKGQLHHGSLNGAGEFGHISLDVDGPRCSCGNRGCLEVFASDRATLRRFHEISKQNANGDKPQAENVGDVVTLALGGNRQAIEALRRTANYLGRGLVPVVYSINPEVIVLGGQITEAWDIIYPEICRALASQVTHFYASGVSIIPSTLEYKPSLIGAITLVLARDLSVPSLG